VFDFSDHVVIVTGAAGNLGSAVVRAFQSAGAKLVLVDRAADRLGSIFADMADSPNHLFVPSIDLTKADDVQTMVERAINHFGRIDVLANTAGGYRAGTPVHETPIETWDFMLNLNARSVFLASRAVIPHMLREGHGKIISVAASGAARGRANMAAYTVSKAAVIRLTESMAAELKDEGINVNCVMPGTIDTPANRQAMPDADYSRWTKPEAIADVILFLASEGARTLNGASIPV
jgi:NAD(P)-dependent dehydrogenase (short-subunit alcohol dehydrogenase family)